jgi:hypothetical protein
MLEDLDIQSVLLIFISIVLIFVFIFVYSELSKTDDLKDQISNLKMECPSCPQCPDMTCPTIDIPDLTNSKCPECPECPQIDCPQCPKPPSCPKCPGVDYPSVKDIVKGIFPGKDPGISITGDYFPATTLLDRDSNKIPFSSDESNIVSLEDNELIDQTSKIENETILRDGMDIVKEENIVGDLDEDIEEGFIVGGVAGV